MVAAEGELPLYVKNELIPDELVKLSERNLAILVTEAACGARCDGRKLIRR